MKDDQQLSEFTTSLVKAYRIRGEHLASQGWSRTVMTAIRAQANIVSDESLYGLAYLRMGFASLVLTVLVYTATTVTVSSHSNTELLLELDPLYLRSNLDG